MKLMKRVSAVLLVAVLLACMSVTAFAADNAVTYMGGADKFVYTNSGDLFGGLKGVMPGDKLTQTIQVKVNDTYSRTDYVKLYLRAEPHDDSNKPVSGVSADASNQLLSYMYMTVYNGSTVIYQADPNEPGALQDNVLLGQFRKGEGTTLTVALYVDENLPSGYMNQIGEVDWVFTAEEYDKAGTPQTGDDTNAVPYVVGLAGSVIAIVLLLIVFKRRKKEE